MMPVAPSRPDSWVWRESSASFLHGIENISDIICVRKQSFETEMQSYCHDVCISRLTFRQTRTRGLREANSALQPWFQDLGLKAHDRGSRQEIATLKVIDSSIATEWMRNSCGKGIQLPGRCPSQVLAMLPAKMRVFQSPSLRG